MQIHEAIEEKGEAEKDEESERSRKGRNGEVFIVLLISSTTNANSYSTTTGTPLLLNICPLNQAIYKMKFQIVRKNREIKRKHNFIK